MANNNTVSTSSKIACLSPSQCTTDFLKQLSTAKKPADSWLSLFPVASQRIKHFFKLPEQLLFLNGQYWHAAKELIETCNAQKQSFLALQNYDQEVLFGRINLINGVHQSSQQGVINDFNEGILVLHISPLLVTPKLWFLVKSFLLTQRIPSQAPVNSDKSRGETPARSTVQLNTKIIMVANRYQLDELTQIDPDYSQISALFTEISADIKRTDENIHSLQHYCQTLVEKKSLTPLSDEALNTLFIYLSRLCEHQNKLLFSPQLIESTLRYAQLLQSEQRPLQDVISAQHIQQTLDLHHKSQSNAQDFSDQALVEKQLKIQLSGETIGQINGLSVVELIGYPTEFGEIFRISASEMVGDGEIIDVERKVELAGNVHAKSTLIVQGYLNHFFTHMANFPLSCNVVFEQSYQESDGDSASLAILLAVTSCYSQAPIAQNLFVTGALDQRGNVLAIGGINQKIESITRLFLLGLLTEPVTVLMPQANQINLMLSDVTLSLIKDKKINIYAIQHSIEAFPYTMGNSFEKVLEAINKRILFLHKDEDDEPLSFVTKCLNLLR